MRLRLASASPSTEARKRPLKVVIGLVAALLILSWVSLTSFALAASNFSDVPTNHQYYTAISDLASRGIIGGYTDGRFGPADPVTRQQFAKMMVLTAGYPVSESNVCYFTDVPKSDATTLYPDNYIAVCAAYGITTGKTPTTFDPYSNITRWQMVTMVVRTADSLQPGLLATPPSGFVSNSTWASNVTHGANAARAEYNGLLNGINLASLSPAGNMTRGEVAQVLYNLLVTLVSGPVVTTSTTIATTTSTTVSLGSPLEIVSIHYDAEGDDNKNLNDEYIVFRVTRAGSLFGYAIQDEYGWRYDFPNRVFSAGQVFKLHTGVGTDTQTDLYWNKSGSAVWNNTGDTVKVLDSQGRVVLSRSY